MKPGKLSDDERLRHMLDAANEALSFARGRSRADLDDNRMLALALVRLLEVIGEAGARVSPERQARLPHIPWREVTGMRNRLIHGYAEVDLDIVWAVIEEDLPKLVADLAPELDAPADQS